MSERIVLVPGDTWVECVLDEDGSCNIEIHSCHAGNAESCIEREFLLYDDEMLKLVSIHPAVKRLIDWADSLVGVMNTRMGYADDWNEGREILRLFGRREE